MVLILKNDFYFFPIFPFFVKNMKIFLFYLHIRKKSCTFARFLYSETKMHRQTLYKRALNIYLINQIQLTFLINKTMKKLLSLIAIMAVTVWYVIGLRCSGTDMWPSIPLSVTTCCHCSGTLVSLMGLTGSMVLMDLPSCMTLWRPAMALTASSPCGCISIQPTATQSLTLYVMMRHILSAV